MVKCHAAAAGLLQVSSSALPENITFQSNNKGKLKMVLQIERSTADVNMPSNTGLSAACGSTCHRPAGLLRLQSLEPWTFICGKHTGHMGNLGGPILSWAAVVENSGSLFEQVLPQFQLHRRRWPRQRKDKQPT